MAEIQTQDEILIPERRIILHKGREFECLETNGQYHALMGLKAHGYSPVFMPQLIDARIEAPKDSRLWRFGYTTPSMIITGRIENEPMVIFDHRPDNYFSAPENLKKSLDLGLYNRAGIVPQPEFQRAVNHDQVTDDRGNRLVWVLKGKNYKKFRDSTSDIISVERALEHPQTIPFIGGEERAKRYLERHKEVYGNDIGVWHSDDLRDEPMGRLLYLGDGDDGSLGGDGGLVDDARFVGVRDGAQKILEPSLETKLEDVAENLSKLHPEFVREAWKNAYIEQLKEGLK